MKFQLSDLLLISRGRATTHQNIGFHIWDYSFKNIIAEIFHRWHFRLKYFYRHFQRFDLITFGDELVIFLHRDEKKAKTPFFFFSFFLFHTEKQHTIFPSYSICRHCIIPCCADCYNNIFLDVLSARKDSLVKSLQSNIF